MGFSGVLSKTQDLLGDGPYSMRRARALQYKRAARGLTFSSFLSSSQICFESFSKSEVLERMADLTIVSADSHIIEPAELWTSRSPCASARPKSCSRIFTAVHPICSWPRG